MSADRNITPASLSSSLTPASTFSPTLRKGVGLALLSREISDGDEVHVDVRGRSEAFMVTKPPFVNPDVGTA